MDEIIATTLFNPSNIDDFNNKKVHRLKLSQLRKRYKDKDGYAADLIPQRHTIQIDEEFLVKTGTGNAKLTTSKTMLDYHLTVANCIGLGAILPNGLNGPRFVFEMDLKSRQREFKGKHAMVGFDTKGRMLYIGQAMNEEVFLAMAPNEFISCEMEPCRAGYSSGPSQMSRRHVHQTVLMMIHFLARIPERSFANVGDIYSHDLEAPNLEWDLITSAL